MLVEVIFNHDSYKYRTENEDKLLLYNPRTGNLFFITGNSKELLLKIINRQVCSVDESNKYIKFFISNKILLRRENQ